MKLPLGGSGPPIPTMSKAMAGKRPTTIAEYIRLLHARASRICAGCTRSSRASHRRPRKRSSGEPRFSWTPIPVRILRAQGALQLRADTAALEPFRKELAGYQTTKNYLQVPYDEPLPEELIRKIAKYRVRELREREDDAFW